MPVDENVVCIIHFSSVLGKEYNALCQEGIQ